MKNFGFTGYDTVEHVGTNGKMNEVSAAMGLTSLESMDEFIEVNRSNYNSYKEGLKSVPGIKLMDYDDGEKFNFQYIVVEVDEELMGLSRDALINILHEENIMARRYFYPGCHRMEPYRSLFPNAGMLLPETEKVGKRVVTLPTGTATDSKHIEGICSVIALVAKNGKEVSRKLCQK